MKKPVTKLVDMNLSELSLVTRGANQHANIAILKGEAHFDEGVNTPSQHPEPGDSVNSEMNKQRETQHMSVELEKKAEGLEAQVAELKKKLDDAEVIAKMNDDEKEYLANLDKEAAEAFRGASAADRAKMMKKSADSDEVFKSADGHEIRKSAVGDGVFAILKSQDEALRSTREEMVKAADRALTVEFTKKAEDEFANLPGEIVAKVAVLKGMNSMDEAARETLNAMLKAGNDALAKGFQTFGHSGGKPSDITKAAKLDAAIKKIMDNDPSVSRAIAMTKAMAANPELYEG